jgi:hypothetical protein
VLFRGLVHFSIFVVPGQVGAPIQATGHTAKRWQQFPLYLDTDYQS